MNIAFNIQKPAFQSSLPGMVNDLLKTADYKFGKSGGTVRSVRGDFNSLINRYRGAENKARKEKAIADGNENYVTVTAYDIVRGLSNKDAEAGFKTAFAMDSLFAFGRRIAQTVGFTSHLSLNDIKECLSILCVDWVNHEGNSYISLSELTEEAPHTSELPSNPEELDNLQLAEAIDTAIESIVPDGATPIPAEVQTSRRSAKTSA